MQSCSKEFSLKDDLGLLEGPSYEFHLEDLKSEDILYRASREEPQIMIRLTYQNSDQLARCPTRFHGDVDTGDNPLEQVVVNSLR